MKSIILIYVLLASNLSFAKEKPVYVHDPFTVYYPHLGDSICRIKSFEIDSDTSLNTEKKIKAWKLYKNICSKNGSYQLLLADTYTADENYKAAKEILENAIQNATYDTRYHKSHLHEVYLQLGETDRSIDLAASIVTDYPDFDGGYKCFGVNFYVQQNWVKAKKLLELAVLLNNKNYYAYQLLTRVSYELKEHDKVHLYYEKAFAINPFITLLDRSSSLSILAVYIYERNFEEARSMITQLLEFDPTIKDNDKFINLQKCYENELKKQDQNN